MGESSRPNKNEIIFLHLSYNRFYELFEEVFSDEFWEKSPFYRFSKIKDGFSVYSELLSYEPFKDVFDYIEKQRPEMESVIGQELFKVIRNIVSHYPFFDSWNDVWINNSLANWYKKGQSIDKFFTKYSGNEQVKYRIWEEKHKKMTYLSIDFPCGYLNDKKIYLKDILNEKEGVKFSFILMRKILNTQVVDV